MVHESERRPLHKDIVDATMIDFVGILHPSQIEPFAFLLEESLEFKDKQMLGWLNGILKKTPSIDGRRAGDLVEILKHKGYDVPGIGSGPEPREPRNVEEKKRGMFQKD